MAGSDYITFQGDKNVAQNNIHIGRKLLQVLKSASGQVYFNQMIKTIDGVTYTVSFQGNKDYIDIAAPITTPIEYPTPIYLESGFFNNYSTFWKDETAYYPSRVCYGSEEAHNHDSSTPRQGNHFPSGKTYIGEKLLERPSKAITDGKALSKTTPHGFVKDTPIFGDEEMLSRKMCVSRVSPSSYTGLLALFVQSLYGTLPVKYDYSSVISSIDKMPRLPVRMKSARKNDISFITLEHQGINSHWILRNDNWDYWLVCPGTNVWKIREIVLEAKQKPLNKVSSYSELEARQLHALMLSTGYVGDVILEKGIGFDIIGDPLYYGWKPDDTGENASIVCHKVDNVNSYYIARQYNVTISMSNKTTKQKVVPTGISVTLAETANWKVTSQDQTIWVPTSAPGVGFSAITPPGSSGSWAKFTCNAPLYVQTYGTTIRILGSSTGGTVGFSSVGSVSGSGIQTYGNSFGGVDIYTFPNDYQLGNFPPLDIYSYDHPNGPGGYPENYRVFYPNMSWKYNGADVIDFWSYPLNQVYFLSTRFKDIVRYVYPSGTFSHVFNSSLLIPYHSSESVIITTHSVDTTTYAAGTKYSGTYCASYEAQAYYYASDGVGLPGYWHYLGESVQSDGYGNYPVYYQGGPFTITEPWTPAPEVVSTTTSTLITRKTSITVSTDFDVVDAYLQPALVTYPFLDNTYVVKESRGGSYYYVGCFGENGSNDWPGGATCPVGWA